MSEEVNLKLAVGTKCCICPEIIREGEEVIYRFYRVLNDGKKSPKFAHLLCYELEFCSRAYGSLCDICDEEIQEGEDFSFIDRYEREEYVDTPVFAHIKCIEDAAIHFQRNFVPWGHKNKWLKYLPPNFDVKAKTRAYYSTFERRYPGRCYFCVESTRNKKRPVEKFEEHLVHVDCKEAELKRRERKKDKAKYGREFTKKKCAKCSEKKKIECIEVGPSGKRKCFREYVEWRKKKQKEQPTLNDYA